MWFVCTRRDTIALGCSLHNERTSMPSFRCRCSRAEPMFSLRDPGNAGRGERATTHMRDRGKLTRLFSHLCFVSYCAIAQPSPANTCTVLPLRDRSTRSSPNLTCRRAIPCGQARHDPRNSCRKYQDYARTQRRPIEKWSLITGQA